MANDETRKRLAALRFSEKIRLLEKLRDRSLAISRSREKLAKARERAQIAQKTKAQ